MSYPYTTTTTGIKFIPGFTSFNTPYLNELSYDYRIFSNRLYDETMSLPKSYSDIKITPNTPILTHTINNIIGDLYNNYIYILTRCKIGKTDAFLSYRGATGISESVYSKTLTGGFTGDQAQLDQTKIDNKLTSSINDAIITTTLGSDVYGYIVAVGNELQMYKFTPTDKDLHNCTIQSVSTKASEKLIDSSSDLTFGNILKVSQDKRGNLYVLDDITNVVYMYNIKGLTRNDRILMARKTPGRQLQSFFGGIGATSENTKFDTPIDMLIDEDKIYILDSSTRDYRVKVYDTQFNWQNTYNLSLDYVSAVPISITINNGVLYVLTAEGDINLYRLVDLEVDILTIHSTHPANVIDFDFNAVENYIDIQFSPTNTNLCYITTNRGVYKRYRDKISQSVGDINWIKHQVLSNSTGIIKPRVLSFITRDTSVQDIMLLVVDNPSDGTVLLHFSETQNLMEMLLPGYETDIYPLSSIRIKSEEYVSALVYNKTIAKLLHNISLLYSNVRYVASMEVDINGDLKYPGIRYISEQEINQYRSEVTSMDVYIGVNEILSTGVINRCINSIVSEQLKFLKLISTRHNPRSFYTAGKVVLKDTPIPHLDYLLPSGRSYKKQKI